MALDPTCHKSRTLCWSPSCRSHLACAPCTASEWVVAPGQHLDGGAGVMRVRKRAVTFEACWVWGSCQTAKGRQGPRVGKSSCRRELWRRGERRQVNRDRPECPEPEAKGAVTPSVSEEREGWALKLGENATWKDPKQRLRRGQRGLRGFEHARQGACKGQRSHCCPRLSWGSQPPPRSYCNHLRGLGSQLGQQHVSPVASPSLPSRWLTVHSQPVLRGLTQRHREISEFKVSTQQEGHAFAFVAAQTGTKRVGPGRVGPSTGQSQEAATAQPPGVPRGRAVPPSLAKEH